jgi:hypothetical protein
MRKGADSRSDCCHRGRIGADRGRRGYWVTQCGELDYERLREGIGVSRRQPPPEKAAVEEPVRRRCGARREIEETSDGRDAAASHLTPALA